MGDNRVVSENVVKDDEFAERLRGLAADNAARGAREFANALIDAFRRILFAHRFDIQAPTFTGLQVIDLIKLARDDVKRPDAVIMPHEGKKPKCKK